VTRLLALAAAVLALLAGCGGDDDQTDVEAWADDVCGSVLTWRDAVTEAADSLQNGSGSPLDRAQSAVDEVQAATGTLRDELEGLEAPRTQAGETAQGAIDELAASLRGDLAAIETATADVTSVADALAAASTVTDALTDMRDAVARALDELDGTDAEAELREAFDASDSCRELRRGR
jgi:hypothetical protein